MKLLTSLALVVFASACATADEERRVNAKSEVFLDWITIPSVGFDESKKATIMDAAHLAWSFARELDSIELNLERRGITILVRTPSLKEDWVVPRGRLQEVPADLRELKFV
jgi:hypothetical protein